MQRPIITTYSDLVHFIGDMLAFLKSTQSDFSVLRATKSLRRVSPALISLVLSRKRRVTMDRADELSRLLGLTPHERQYMKDWISGSDRQSANPQNTTSIRPPADRRKIASSHLLNDWVHVFVKDAFDLAEVRKNPVAIYALLGGIASRKRIDESISFLLKHGYLRKTIDGQLIPEATLHSVDQKISSDKVRKFHKALLKNAHTAIDQYPSDQRYANSLVLSLNQETYKKLLELIAEQAESLQSFAENLNDGSMLYQVVINVSPTGGKCA